MIQKVYWTSIALFSLKEVNGFILSHWNNEISHHFLDSVDSIIELLIKNPNIGSKVVNTSFRKVLINKHVALFYEQENQNLTILLIWDNRQDRKKLKNKLISP